MSDLIHIAARRAADFCLGRHVENVEPLEAILRAALAPLVRDHEALNIMRASGLIPLRVPFDDGSVWWMLHDEHNATLWLDGKCTRRWPDPAEALIAASAILAAARAERGTPERTNQ